VQDPKSLHQFLRMSGDTFDDLLHIVGPYLEKQNTNFKEAIPPEERLAVTLRFLAQGILHSLLHTFFNSLCHMCLHNETFSFILAHFAILFCGGQHVENVLILR
jgi:hypothetical protein